MAKSEDEHKPDRVMIGETADKEPIVKEQSTGKTFIFMATEKAEQLEKLKKEKEIEKEKQKEKEIGKGKVNIMTDENTTKLESKIAKLEAKLANDEKNKYDRDRASAINSPTLRAGTDG